MCSKHPFEACYGACKCPLLASGTATGRISGSQPNIQEPSELLRVGSLWSHRNSGKVVKITAVQPGIAGKIYYTGETVATLGWSRKYRFLRCYEPAPITAKECRIKSITLDFSDIEQRVIAALEGSNTELPCGLAGKDLHKLRAAEIFDVKPSEVTPAMRRVGKAANFITAYTHKEKRNG